MDIDDSKASSPHKLAHGATAASPSSDGTNNNSAAAPTSNASPSNNSTSQQNSATSGAQDSSSSTAMDIDSGGGSSAASSSSSSSSSVLQGHLSSIVKSFKTPSAAEPVLKHLLKTLSSLRRAPNLLAHRKLRMDNMAVKKFISELEGALAMVTWAGYQIKEVGAGEKKVKYLVADENQVKSAEGQARLDEAIAALNDQIAQVESQATASKASSAASDAPRKPCAGGCGFFGSPETEYYCSVCFKKRFLNSATTSPSKTTTSAHRDPYVTPPKPGSAAAAAAASTPPPAAAASSSSSASAAAPSGEKCLRHCGRIGKPSLRGFCDECHTKITQSGLKAPPPRWRCLFDGAMMKLRAVHRFNLGKKPVQVNKNRCYICSKKLGITGFECRCRYVFCAQHRYMEQHDCRYDIKSLHRKKLQKENEEIRAAKIERL